MIKPESKRPITIEDLLRLKRAERPPAEFWSEFDRALRAKQLAALVEKRPWWQTAPRFLVAGFRRYSIPIGATTVAMIAFVSWRTGENTPNAPTTETQPVVVAVASRAPSSAAADAVAAHGARPESPGEGQSFAAAGETPVSPVAEVALASEATTPGEISRMVSLMASASADEASTELTPSARAIAANLATVRGSEPVLARTLLSPVNETRVAARPVVEPLQQIASPSERRRSNLITAMVAMSAYDPPAPRGERTNSRLSEDELYDRVHRFGARANSVNLKF